MSEKELDEFIEIEESTEMDENSQAEMSSTADSLRILEALLFASDELLTAARLKAILPGNPDGKQIRKMVDKINVQLQKERHPFEVVEIGGGYQFRTVSFYHTWVRQIFKDKASKKLSVQALECLAIIAYKQPLSKAEIEAIRGVVSDGAMKTLLEKRLVTISGRSDKPGRPLLYSTTQEFLKYFGLNKIADLPRIEEFEAIAREKMEELSIDELKQPEDTDITDAELLETAENNKESQEENVSADQIPDKSIDQAAAAEQPQQAPVLNEMSEPEGTALFEINIDGDEFDENGSPEIQDSQYEDKIDSELVEAAQPGDSDIDESDADSVSDLSESDKKEPRSQTASTDEVSIEEFEIQEPKNESQDNSSLVTQDTTEEKEEMLEIFLPEEDSNESEKEKK